MNQDQNFMHRAIELARLQHGRTGKNPSVGCVLVGANGTILSEAATGDGGRPHAEQIALSALPDGAARGATAYVTLEPCHTRSTNEPSCAQRLLDAGVETVIIALRDEHPQGRGGLEKLQNHGVTIRTDIMADLARPLYVEFFATLE